MLACCASGQREATRKDNGSKSGTISQVDGIKKEPQASAGKSVAIDRNRQNGREHINERDVEYRGIKPMARRKLAEKPSRGR